MSKKAKAKAKQDRLKKKRGKKAAMQAQYEQWARDGQNKKSKRFRKKKGARTRVKHATAYCGNLACPKCFPSLNDARLAPKHSSIYSLQFTSSKYANVS
jgi:hypothetical protein